MKIEAVTVSINYSDYLSQIISNKEKLDRWLIVTHEDDSDCINLCKKNNLEYFFSKKIYENAYFARGTAVNEALPILDRDDCIFQLDSEILLPDNFRNVVDKNCIDKTVMYWSRRYYKSGKEMKWIVEEVEEGEVMGLGFFQMWHSSKRKDYPTISDTAGWDDIYMRDSFDNIVELPLKCIDVCGYYGQDHFGKYKESPTDYKPPKSNTLAWKNI